MSNDIILSTLIPPTRDNTGFLSISPTKILQSKSFYNSSIPTIDYEDKSNNITLLNGLQNFTTTTTTMIEEINNNKSELIENINDIFESTTFPLDNLTNTNIFNNISSSTVSQKMEELFNDIAITNKSQDMILSSSPTQTTTTVNNIIQNISNVINTTLGEIKKDYEILGYDNNTSTSMTTTTIKTTNLRHNYNLLEKYPFLVIFILIAIVIIFILFLGVVISFLITNRRRIIRQERSDKVLREYGNPTNKRNVIKYLFTCCGKKREDFGNLERQISASNLAPYRRPPLPPIKKKNENDEDGFEGSYVPDGRQRLRPIQILDPAVYGTLENDASTRSTINQSYKSTTLTTNTSTIGTNQKRKNFYKEREL
uniref:SEA domain-containing protein n=1 Tax=Strongyloides venezuelensis TaxID=75913 RepID=A0A0K0F180_STRVS